MNRQRSWPVLAAFLLATAFLPHQIQAAGDPPTGQKLLADDGAAGDSFGESVSISGDTAIIGATGDDDKGDGSGSAYIFVRAGDGIWKQQAKLTPADGAAGDIFGFDVSISGDTALIGAMRDDDKGDGSGSAYIFVRSGDGIWTQQAKLTAADGAGGDRFGTSVSISGDTAIIGASEDDDKSEDSGSAYVFVRAADGTWKQQAKLTPADGAAEDNFGESVFLSGDTAVIGAPDDDDKGKYSGSAYIFVRAGDGIWKQQAKLTAADGAAEDNFGVVVSLSGDTALIGAWEDRDNKGCYFGSVYVFVRAGDGTWKQEAKLTAPAPDGDVANQFGRSVSLSGDTAVIGLEEALFCRGSQAAYIFIRAGDGTWQQQIKLTAPDCGKHADDFGTSVSLSGDTLFVGAPKDKSKGDDTYGTGSVYIYSLPDK